MKTKLSVILAMLVATAGLTQTVTNETPPAAAGTATNQPVARGARATTGPRRSAAPPRRSGRAAAVPETPAAPLVTNELAVAKQDNINVRGQAKINSEIVARLKRGDEVLVLEEITVRRPPADEPPKWARVVLPPGTHVWVHSSFLDANQTVKPAKLNIRAGAGENYSILGLLHKGDTVKGVETKGDWTAFEAGTNAYAFVASHLLMHKEPVATPVPPPPTTTSVVQNQPTVATPTDPTVTNPPVQPVPIIAPAVPEPRPAPVDPGPPPKRIVQREGIVGSAVSIQAPTYYQLESLETGKAIDYLYTTSTNLVLKRYKGLTVLVTGEESLDERWANTPVLTIQKIQVVQ